MSDESLFAALFEEDGRQPVSVSELNADIKGTLENRFSSIWVEGEITGFHAAASGHWYFSLTDGSSVIKAACFKGQNFRIRFKPSDGLLVRVRGRVTTYEARGEYQIIVESLEPVGEGALAIAFEQIKAKLAAEGLFDPALKRSLPPFPRRIGIVTSPTGAAIHDILTVLERRAGSVSVVIVPTLVQGEKAAEQIAHAIAIANEFNDEAPEDKKIDVLIVGRGGGSAEDLWAFNEECVARAIRNSQIPVISAVGHEIDVSIADLAADVRAATPSAAAEIVARAETEIIAGIDQASMQLFRSMQLLMFEAKSELQSLSMSPVFTQFPAYIRDLRYRVDSAESVTANAAKDTIRVRLERLRGIAERLSPLGLAAKVGDNKERLGVLDQQIFSAGRDIVGDRTVKLERSMAWLDSMSPLRVLDRGYSLTQTADGKLLQDASTVTRGEEVKVRLAKGSLTAEVKEIEK